MTRKSPYRPAAPAPRVKEPDLGLVARGGPVHRTYLGAEPAERRGVIEAVGLKHCQRMGHRHKVPVLRDVKDLTVGWEAVDTWLTDADGVGGPRAVGDLFDPLLRALVERARELLGDHADDPTADQLGQMADALAAERSGAQARMLLAAVVEYDFTAAPDVQDLAARDERWALPAQD